MTEPEPIVVDSVNDLEGVELELLDADAETICAYGNYALEQLADDQWVTVPWQTPNGDPPPFPSCYFEATPYGGRSDDEGHGHVEEIPVGPYFGELVSPDQSGKLAPAPVGSLSPFKSKLKVTGTTSPQSSPLNSTNTASGQ